MNQDFQGAKPIKANDGPFKEMMVASREMALILNKENLLPGENVLIDGYRKRIVESIAEVRKTSKPDTKEEMFVGIIQKIIDFLDEHGYTPEAFYDYQLEHGTLS